jgi:hypothetical protein
MLRIGGSIYKQSFVPDFALSAFIRVHPRPIKPLPFQQSPKPDLDADKI